MNGSTSPAPRRLSSKVLTRWFTPSFSKRPIPINGSVFTTRTFTPRSTAMELLNRRGKREKERRGANFLLIILNIKLERSGLSTGNKSSFFLFSLSFPSLFLKIFFLKKRQLFSQKRTSICLTQIKPL